MKKWKAMLYPNANGEERKWEIEADEIDYQWGRDILFRVDSKIIGILNKSAFETIEEVDSNE